MIFAILELRHYRPYSEFETSQFLTIIINENNYKQLEYNRPRP